MTDVLFLMLTALSFNLGLWLYLCFNVASCVLSFLLDDVIDFSGIPVVCLKGIDCDVPFKCRTSES
jgi:hypothetical protein